MPCRRADELLGKMTLREKIGQCFTFGFAGTMLTPDIFHAVEDLGCAGVRLTPWCTCFGRYADPHRDGDEEDPRKTGTIMPEFSSLGFTFISSENDCLIFWITASSFASPSEGITIIPSSVGLG